ncbi:MAG: PEP-utilizing enzyme, partial [Nitrosopumilus sp.]
SAQKGVIKGNVLKLLEKDYPNAKKVFKNKKDYILVTPMTRPEIVQYIKRSLAIITDEGGITCHASIIAREMNKPCIIGTKIATKVLKDGDLVEVDAEKGIVRILKRC